LGPLSFEVGSGGIELVFACPRMNGTPVMYLTLGGNDGTGGTSSNPGEPGDPGTGLLVLVLLAPVLQLLALTLVATVSTLRMLALLYLVNALLAVDVLIIELRQFAFDEAMDEMDGAGVLRCVYMEGEWARCCGVW